jgi:hypothetical protein
VLEWVEQWRAGALRWRPARPPDDAVLAELLAELRRLAALEDEARLAGDDPRPHRRQRLALERRVLAHTRHAVDDGAGLASITAPLKVAALGDALGDRALVEYLLVDGDLLAVTVRRGAVRLHRVGAAAPVEDGIAQVRFALRTMAATSGSPAAREAARGALLRLTRTLDEQLLVPVLPEVGDAELVLVPSAGLRDVPWMLLGGCAERPVSVTPSATLWLRAASRPAPPPGGRATLVSGPDLPAGTEEVAHLAGQYPGATFLHGPDATVAAVLAGLDGSDVAHVATHGTVRADNPFFSALRVADGPLTVFDLERLTAPPALMLLPACQSGVTVSRPGEEMLGLAAALLALGTRSLVATVAPVSDTATARLMVLLHERLRAGDTPAHALAASQHTLCDSEDEVLAAAAAFACYGAG